MPKLICECGHLTAWHDAGGFQADTDTGPSFVCPCMLDEAQAYRAAQFRAAVAHLKALRACVSRDTPKNDWLWLRFWLALECYRAVGILPKREASK